ncbi:MAG: hypothetical protein ABIO31_00195 [Candidatus Nitrotoga sp.]
MDNDACDATVFCHKRDRMLTHQVAEFVLRAEQGEAGVGEFM